MLPQTRRSLGLGLVAGLVAGLVFSLLEMISASAMGMSALAPWRAFASIPLGQRALEDMAQSTALPVGIVVHFALSALFGLVYGRISAGLSTAARRSWARQALLGLAFGAALYLVNFQLVARAAFPWFLAMNQPVQLALHALFFGVPLGLTMAAAEQRLPRAREMRPA